MCCALCIQTSESTKYRSVKFITKHRIKFTPIEYGSKKKLASQCNRYFLDFSPCLYVYACKARAAILAWFIIKQPIHFKSICGA